MVYPRPITVVVAFLLANGMAEAQNWVPLNSSTTRYLRSVHFISPDTGWAVGDAGTMVKTVNGGSTWFSPSGIPGNNLLCVRFANASVGYVAGDSGISKTLDGGMTWFRQNVPPISSISSIHLANADTAWAAGRIGPSGINRGLILKTLDGGNTWLPESSGTGGLSGFASIYFTGIDTGWAVGAQPGNPLSPLGLFSRTIDGGVTWSTQYFSSTGACYSIHFANGRTGWMASNSGIYKSADGGLTWVLQSGASARCVFVLDANTVHGGIIGGILKSEDGGTSWNQTDSGPVGPLAIIFPTPGIGYAVGQGGLIMKSGPSVQIVSSENLKSDHRTGAFLFFQGASGPSILITTPAHGNLVKVHFDLRGKFLFLPISK